MSTDLEKYKKALARQKANTLKTHLESLTYEEIDKEIKELNSTFKNEIAPMWEPYQKMVEHEDAKELFESMTKEEEEEYEKISNYVIYHAVILLVYNEYRDKKKRKSSLTVVK